jgi:hypothetical protein
MMGMGKLGERDPHSGVFHIEWVYQHKLAIRMGFLSPILKDILRCPHSEVWHTAELIPAGPADVSSKARISLSRVS